MEKKVMDTNIDLLNRQPFIDGVLRVIDVLSNSHKNACYAIDGKWGAGKTFVLKKLEEQIPKKYHVFNYNCWKYDYYDEPLIAIVVSMIDEIDEKEFLFNKEQKTVLLEGLKIVGEGLLRKTLQVVNDKTGIDLKEVSDTLKNVITDSKEIMNETRNFDNYRTFKKQLLLLRENIEKISEKETVIFLVDELDRCLPEYSIKTLERLHHLFDDIPNVQVIFSIDKGQLEHAVNQIYGQYTDVNAYLEKFFAFEISLDTGAFNDLDKFREVFGQYMNGFENIYNVVDDSEVDEFFEFIFEGINIRSRIKIIEKCHLLHKLLRKSEEKMDYIYMCVSILLSLVKCAEVDLEQSRGTLIYNHMFVMKTDDKFLGLRKLEKKICGQTDEEFFFTEKGKTYLKARGLWGTLLILYRRVLNDENDVILRGFPEMGNVDEYVTGFWDLTKTIK